MTILPAIIASGGSFAANFKRPTPTTASETYYFTSTCIIRFVFGFLLLTSEQVCPASGIYWKLQVFLEDYLFSEECFPVSCSQPRLRLILKDFSWAAAASSDYPPSERSIGWPISKETLTLGSGKPGGGAAVVSSHQPSWTSILTPDEAGNMSVHAAISGIDSTYNFPRICDSTGPAPVSIRREFSATHPLSDGTCFNATLKIVWSCCGYDCPAGAIYDCCDAAAEDPRITEAYGGDNSGGPPHVAYTGPLQGYVPGWIALVLGVTALLFFVIVLLLLTAYLNRGKQATADKMKNGGGGVSGTKKFPSSSHHSARIVRKDSQDSGKYDVPWDQKFRPLPEYVRTQVGGGDQQYQHTMTTTGNTNGNTLNHNNTNGSSHYSSPNGGVHSSFATAAAGVGNLGPPPPPCPRLSSPKNGNVAALYATTDELKLRDEFAE